ncbi:MAG: VirB3 family type IV secretion system protein [Neisseriaceae bacterium]|nr:VirB3 family type IV secretion system protein [Neisseriaceae bacterium]MBR3425518.1 VirB3 family type IV secretion system protein [Neisseriaceae bacterium]
MSEEYETHPLFRGATKPRMLFGVPLIELGIVVMPCVFIGLIAKILTGSILAYGIGIIPLMIAFFVMRQWTKEDDQKVKMYALDMREQALTRQCKIDGVTVITPKPVRHTRFMEW